MLTSLIAHAKGKISTRDEPRSAKSRLELHGFCVLPHVLSESECDAITKSFDDYVNSHREEADNFLLPTNRHSRLCNMHLASEPARLAITKPRVMAALDAFFDDKTYVATSLYFEQSSEQAIHRDTPFFHTKPRMAFAGVWFALEDVRPDAGPLRYFPGGHKIKIKEHVARPDEESKPAWLNAYYRYSADIEAEIHKSRLTEKTAFIKKGDCFIWHPELPHGGSPIRSPGKTRKSMVFHCAPESVKMYGPDEFFGLTPFAEKANCLVPLTADRNMMDTGAPVFAQNN